MTDYKNHPDADKPLITSVGYAGKRTSIKEIVKRANRVGVPIPDFMWSVLNNRYLRMVQVWKARYNRQRQHAIKLQNLLTEKNAYILELRADVERLENQNGYLYEENRELHHGPRDE